MRNPKTDGSPLHARRPVAVPLAWFGVAFLIAVAGCGDALGVGNGPGGAGSDKARFTFDCNVDGFVGALTLDVEVIEDFGVTWGPGSNPDITGVIGTGESIYYTTGTLSFSDRTYSISGRNSFADLWSNIPGDRLVVEWQVTDGGLVMVWDWFGSATPSRCDLTGSNFL